LSAVFGRTNCREPVSLLLVDDDEDVRVLLRGRLESAGYRVAEAPNGEVALQMYRRNPTEVVLTDIVMPEMDGRKLISALRDSFPDVRIMLVGDRVAVQIVRAASRPKVERQPQKGKSKPPATVTGIALAR